MTHANFIKQRSSTLFLRGVVMSMGLAVLAICVFVLPLAIRADWDTWFLPMFLSMYAAAIPFYIALYHTLQLLHYIDTDKAFSKRSVKSLKSIKYAAATISALYLVISPYFYYIANHEDAPGFMVIGLLFIGGPLVIAVFAAVLQKLLQHAIALKSENDLTV